MEKTDLHVVVRAHLKRIAPKNMAKFTSGTTVFDQRLSKEEQESDLIKSFLYFEVFNTQCYRHAFQISPKKY